MKEIITLDQSNMTSINTSVLRSISTPESKIKLLRGDNRYALHDLKGKIYFYLLLTN